MKFEIYRRRTLRGWRWFWRLRAGNRKIVASGEGYFNKADALWAVEMVRSTGPLTAVEELPSSAKLRLPRLKELGR